MENKKILIMGLGNEILSDDSIGLRLIKSLSGIVDNPEIRFETGCCGGLEIMEYLRGYQKAILIDAIRTINGIPGQVYHFIPACFKETSNLSSLHDVNFLTAMHLADMLDIDMPSDLHIIAVEIIEDMVFGEKLTPILEKNYSSILKEVYTLVDSIIAHQSS